MKTYNNLPVYEATFDDEDLLIEAISLVKRPAVKREFLAMQDQALARFDIEDEDQHIVFGLIMAVDMLIYRRDSERGEYYVTFSSEAVEKARTDFMRSMNYNNINPSHNINADGKPIIVDDVFMISSYLKDSDNGIDPKGYEDINNGSWFGAWKIENEQIWADIKAGKFKGFSVHGTYGLMETKTQDEITELLYLIDEVDNNITELLN